MEKKKITSRRAKAVNKKAKVEMVTSVEEIIEKVVRKVLDHELKDRVISIIINDIQVGQIKNAVQCLREER